MTPASFALWRMKFDIERAEVARKDEVEMLKGLTPKEREEVKKNALKKSGTYQRKCTI